MKGLIIICLLYFIFILLKIFNGINLSWLIILMPLIVPIGLFLIALLLTFFGLIIFLSLTKRKYDDERTYNY